MNNELSDLCQQQSKKEMSRMQQALNAEEYEATKCLTKEQKHKYLESAYEECVNEYRHIIERVSESS